jgi:hypothetical protein
MLIMNSIDLIRKYRSTYEAFSSNRPCYDESKGSSDGKQSKCELHDEQLERFNELKEQ